MNWPDDREQELDAKDWPATGFTPRTPDQRPGLRESPTLTPTPNFWSPTQLPIVEDRHACARMKQ